MRLKISGNNNTISIVKDSTTTISNSDRNNTLVQ